LSKESNDGSKINTEAWVPKRGRSKYQVRKELPLTTRSSLRSQDSAPSNPVNLDASPRQPSTEDKLLPLSLQVLISRKDGLWRSASRVREGSVQRATISESRSDNENDHATVTTSATPGSPCSPRSPIGDRRVFDALWGALGSQHDDFFLDDNTRVNSENQRVRYLPFSS